MCGEIVGVGDGVEHTRIGERVLIEPCIRESRGRLLETPWFFGSECDGGFADYTTVAAKHAYPVDAPLSSLELASFPCSYSTAENMLTRTGARDNEVVLITGASGGVGCSAAIQLAKARGAYVVAVTSPTKADDLRDIGADKVILRGDDYANLVTYINDGRIVPLVAETYPIKQIAEAQASFERKTRIGKIVLQVDCP